MPVSAVPSWMTAGRTNDHSCIKGYRCSLGHRVCHRHRRHRRDSRRFRRCRGQTDRSCPSHRSARTSRRVRRCRRLYRNCRLDHRCHGRTSSRRLRRQLRRRRGCYRCHRQVPAIANECEHRQTYASKWCAGDFNPKCLDRYQEPQTRAEGSKWVVI